MNKKSVTGFGYTFILMISSTSDSCNVIVSSPSQSSSIPLSGISVCPGLIAAFVSSQSRDSINPS